MNHLCITSKKRDENQKNLILRVSCSMFHALRIKKTLLITFSFFLLGSCIFAGPTIRGEGEVTKVTRNIQGFDQVNVSRGLEVLLIPDDREYLVVEADENLHTVIRTEKKGKVLEIYTDKYIRSAKSKKIHVHYTDLNGIQSSSGSYIESQAPVQTDTLEISASAGSRQVLEIDVTELEGHSSSGAQIKVNGKATTARVKASSGAQFQGRDFMADSCYTDASSGAQIRIGAKSLLKAEASSGAQIRYSGLPAQTDLNSSSGGSVRAD